MTRPEIAATATQRPGPGHALRKLVQPRELVILGVLALELAVFAALAPGFVTWQEVAGAARAVSYIGIAAIGASIVIISGGIDLSSGSVYGLAAVTAAWFVAYPADPWPAPLALASGLVVGCAFGFLNGVAVAYLRVPPFIVTLGTYWIANGIAQRITQAENLPSGTHPFTGDFKRWLAGLDYHFLQVATSGHLTFYGFSAGFVLALVLAILTTVLMHVTPFGRYVYALGGSEEATRHAGVRVPHVKVAIYTLAGFFSGLAGLVYLARLKGVSSGVGRGDELQIIAAAVVGGASLTGGRGSPLGALLGAFIVKFLMDFMPYRNLRDEDAKIAIGLFLIFAVLTDRLISALGAARDRRGSRTAPV